MVCRQSWEREKAGRHRKEQNWGKRQGRVGKREGAMVEVCIWETEASDNNFSARAKLLPDPVNPNIYLSSILALTHLQFRFLLLKAESKHFPSEFVLHSVLLVS